MSDWQRYVDWLLAKYCRSRLRLDWCWCRWRTSAKGWCRWGLQVWSRQVGLVWGIQCGATSTCRPHGSNNNKTKSWTVSWLSLKTKVNLRLHGGQVMSGDWRRPHQVREVSSGSPENHWVPWLIHKAKAEDRRHQHQVGLTGLTGVRWRFPKTSKRRTHIGITRLASGVRKVRSPGIHLMVRRWRFRKCPSGVCILVLGRRCNFVLRLPP
jgi:hypothetical protein